MDEPNSTLDDTPINELMSRDPQRLTKADRARIIARMREGRAQFMAAGSGKAPAAKAPKAPKEKVKLTAADLGL